MKITVITGASSGLGAEFARQIYESLEETDTPQEIWLIARSKENLESTGAKLTGKTFP